MQLTPTFQILKMLALRNFVHLRKYVGTKVLLQQFQKPHRYSIKNDCRGQLACTWTKPAASLQVGRRAGHAAPPSRAPVEVEVPDFAPPKLRVPAQPWDVFQGAPSLETPPPPPALIRDHPSAKTKEEDATSRHQRARLAPKRTGAGGGGAACTCPGRTRGGGVG